MADWEDATGQPSDRWVPKMRWTTNETSVVALFDRAARTYGSRLYCKAGNRALTYAQMQAATDTWAARLRDPVAGKPVALLLANGIAFLAAYLAVLKAGGRPALLNPGLPDASLATLLHKLQPALVIGPSPRPGIPVEVVDEARVLALAEAPVTETVLPRITPDDTAAILFSGGTTGLPKQVEHPHRAMMAAIERMEWGWPTRDAEVWLPVAPFTHIYGFLMGVVNPLLRAGTVVIPERFKPELIVDLLVRERITVFGGGPPAIYQGIMAAETFADARFPDLRVCPGGGAPFPVEVLERWRRATGLTITEGYGMTEIAPIAVNTEAAGLRPGSAGKPVPDTTVEIVDLATGTTRLPDGTPGEIRVRGPHQMHGYRDDPDESAIVLRDGWIYTGDIGVLDADGFLTLTDRKKDVILHKGFNVFPRELEEVLVAHPAVDMACVVGRPDDRAGEVAVAFVSLRGDTGAADLLAHCRDHLVGYKVPAEIRVIESLPVTSARKLDRKRMRDLATLEDA